MIITDKIEYQDSELTYEGVIAYDEKNEKKVPAIMIAHAYGGQSKFEENIDNMGKDWAVERNMIFGNRWKSAIIKFETRFWKPKSGFCI